MNFWPPQPGLTDMQSSRSASRAASRSAAVGVAGIERRAGRHAELVDQPERVVQVRAGLDVHRARVGAGLRELGQLALGLLDHEVHVDRAAALVHEVGERRHDARAERDHGDEMPVHHVDVERARAGVEQLDDLAAERAEVGREDRRQHQCPGRPAHATESSRSQAALEPRRGRVPTIRR